MLSLPLLGAIAAGGVDKTPVELFTSDIIFNLRADFVTESGGAVTQATDRGPAGEHFTNAGGSQSPTLVTVAAANNRPGMLFDGVANRLVNLGITRPAPTTEPTWFWMVATIDGYTTNEIVVSGVGATIMLLQQSPGTPSHWIRNTTGSNANAALGSIPATARFAWEFTGETDSYLHIGSTVVTGANPGDAGTTGFRIGTNNGVNVFANFTLLEILCLPGFPGAEKFSLLELYGAHRYGSGLFP